MSVPVFDNTSSGVPFAPMSAPELRAMLFCASILMPPRLDRIE